MKKILTLLAFLGCMVSAMAQNTGEIKGKITDEKGEGMISASVVILDGNGKSTGTGAKSDFDGNYTIPGLTPGKYDLQFSYLGYNNYIINGVVVSSDKTTFQTVKMELKTNELKVATIVAYKKPLIDKGDTKIEQTATKEDIKNTGAQSVENVASNSAGVTQSDAGKGITINGGREDEVQYIINGKRVIGKPNVPVGNIKEISVLSGGISSKYGDATSGIVNITLNDALQNFGGNIEAKTTEGLDPFGLTRIAASAYGPIVKIKDKLGEGPKAKRTLIGLTGSFQYQHDKDRDPSSIGVYRVKQSVEDDIKSGPLVKNQQGTFNPKAEFITFNDMYKSNVKPNNSGTEYVGSAEIGIYPTKKISLAIGGNLDVNRYNDWISRYTLLNSEHNPLYNELNYFGYVRFNQRIGEKKVKKTVDGQDDKEDKKAKTGLQIQNANYTLQLDYERYQKTYEDVYHGNKLFDYGYIGKFETQTINQYAKTNVTAGGRTYQDAIALATTRDTGVIFTPGTVNPLGARFTEQYYQLLGGKKNANGGYVIEGNKVGLAEKVSDIEQGGALRNGQRSSVYTYDLWANIGRTYPNYGIDKNNESYRGKVDASFDIVKVGGSNNNNHKIELGFEFEQRVQRNYTLNAVELWNIAKPLLNTHIALDLTNPTFRIDGVEYDVNTIGNRDFYYYDTITYKYKADPTKQTYFDKQLRKGLGKDVNGTELLNIDAIDPSKLSIDYFTADDLLKNINLRLNYYGYDYKGNILTSQPTTADYFKKKDADGNYTRLQGAFMPTYAAGYIQDKFFYKDLGFVIGLRVDRYDANQSVLKDNYSLYEVKKAKDVSFLYDADGVTQKTINHPGNISKDAVVYVSANQGGFITGYRDGENWYDRYGRAATGKVVASASSNGLLPYINAPNVEKFTSEQTKSYIKSDNYDPNVSFTNYKAQYLFMPRLQFSFNMTNTSQFFAHYDILSQRPQNRNQLQLSDYYYFAENTGTKNNPNLKPIRKVDYEFGFKQAISTFGSVTVSAFYQETSNLIQLRKIQYAFPSDYTTYDNIDFRSSKGFRLLFDMRRVANFKFNANYTLQFVEGTGSDDQSQLYLVNANNPNFRSVYPVSTDNRHQIKFVLDYRFDREKYVGPKIGNHKLLADFGVNLSLNLRSGSPTRQSDPTQPPGAEATNTVENGSSRSSRTLSLDSRLPWYTRFDLRVNKDYVFNIGKKTDKREARSIGISVYVYIQNLLNSQNELKLYAYTLNANDDGYLTDSRSQVTINSQTNVQAFKDQYRAKVSNPDYFSLPRRIYLGVNVNF